jgi:hypothetical protein
LALNCCACLGRDARRTLPTLPLLPRGGRAPFFTPPEAFARTRLPLEPHWQLLPAPLGPAEFWGRAEADVALYEAGGALVDGDGLRSHNVLAPAGCACAAAREGACRGVQEARPR